MKRQTTSKRVTGTSSPYSHRDRDRSRTLTEDATSFTILPENTRNLQSHAKRVRARTVAITPCIVTTADGREYEYKRTRKSATRVTSTPPALRVKQRNYFLRDNITRYIEVAELYNLDPFVVARLYREHRDNGYGYSKTVETNETYSFRGMEV